MTDHPGTISGAGTLVPVEPPEIRIAGVATLPRTFHLDARGFLVETLRDDDPPPVRAPFRMSYSSLTRPGHFRDVDRWHVHRIQTDRFVVVLGEMILALFDRREDSPTRDRLAVVRMVGATYAARDGTPDAAKAGSHVVTIPPGVLHCIGNLSSDPFLLQNFPTELYDPGDEGRVPFVDLRIPSLGRTFSWDLVAGNPGPI